MDFDLSPEQDAIRGLAAQLLGDKATVERLRAVEAAEPLRFDRDLWAAMAEAGLLGLVVPESGGGAGLGLVELCLLLQEVGRTAAQVPALAALAGGVLPIVRFRTSGDHTDLLPRLADGSVVAVGAFAEPLGDPRRPTLRATSDGDGGWVLDGTRSNVAGGMVADVLVTAAVTDDGSVVVATVDADGPGVSREAQETTSGIPEALVTFVGAQVPAGAVLAGPEVGREALDWIVDAATVATCAVISGVTAAALALTGSYTRDRHQFGHPIATFQAVGQRAADAFVDVQAIELTMLQAAWRLAEDRPADREVAVAKYWAAAGGQRVVHTAQHLHGGMGVDRDYPLHRYFLAAKQLELSLGGASRQLLRLGAILAEQGAAR
jgi:alkylation response protein AidB-like acyl-CoA dehydrogenase